MAGPTLGVIKGRAARRYPNFPRVLQEAADGGAVGFAARYRVRRCARKPTRGTDKEVYRTLAWFCLEMTRHIRSQTPLQRLSRGPKKKKKVESPETGACDAKADQSAAATRRVELQPVRRLGQAGRRSTGNDAT